MSEEKKRAAWKDVDIRDYFAAECDVSYEKAAEFLMAIKYKKNVADGEAAGGGSLFSMLVGMKDSKVTLGELAEMRAFMRYLEADCMLSMRKEVPEFKFIKELMRDSDESEGDKGRWEGIVNE